MPLPGFNPPPPGSVPGYVPTFGPTGTGDNPGLGDPAAPGAAPPAGTGSTYGGIPPYLRQFDNFAKQFYARTGTWPTEADLAAATSDWWNRTGPWQGTPLPNYITPRTSQAAALFSEQYGRFPTQAEIPVALSLLASPGTTGVAETPDTTAVETVTQEISPILQGAGRSVYGDIANRSYYDYLTTITDPKSPAMGFADFLRSQLPTTVGTPGTITQQAPSAAPARVKFSDLMGNQDEYFNTSNEPGQLSQGMQAVIGAYLNQFAPYARGNMFNSILGKAREYGQIYSGQNVSQTGTGPENFASYLDRMMQGYI